ncbi:MULTISPECIES: hypothetical protein [Pseudoalteromonas]|uniref:Orphan protein n=1 Tax=Pseudoalteromonas prydzensis TaxID=182141 RepID=A0ABR9FR28_9GAMM|nr:MULTISPECIES: hypothetical protein [Pseudoalteromonas]MBE0379905.1 hypothetical protein [Pseudoalteromonas prydzensis ACAM 620]MBE0459290.1 hypothetical protein [Pseudoalteromonas prydzensis]WKD25627.1 hypothetical protein NDQ71_22445 [Pseudoalteromonas sp. KG3]
MEISEDKKIQLLYRVEPGCLGPTGAQIIEHFCVYANQHLSAPYFAHYHFIPRFDKSKAEREYSINARLLSEPQVQTYLTHFKTTKDGFEEQLDELLTQAIESFLER